MVMIILLRTTKAKTVNMGSLEYCCVIASCRVPDYRVYMCVHVCTLSFHTSIQLSVHQKWMDGWKDGKIFKETLM
jgi:hypothetical protein